MSRSRDADQTRANAADAARLPGVRALRLHALYPGKIQTMPKCPVESQTDFALWYTSGTAAPARAIAEQPELADEHTNRGNSIAIVADGSRVLGLGDIGPAAALPVMEGKAPSFEYLGGVDATPVCLRVPSTDERVETVCRLEPTFGGINLEDIAQPACFRVVERLRDALSIAVWHDDQQGSATILLRPSSIL